MELRLHHAIRHAGNMNLLAKAIGTSRQRIHNYKTRGMSEEGHNMIERYLRANKVRVAPKGATYNGEHSL